VVIGVNRRRKDAVGHAGYAGDMFSVVEYGFQEGCDFSAREGTTIAGGILFHRVVGEFKWKDIGNGDNIFEGCLVRGGIRDIKKHYER